MQILVLPYRRGTARAWEFAVFHRADQDVWQFVAGGAEEGESPEAAAQREVCEEAGVPRSFPLRRLDSFASIPRSALPQGAHWPDTVRVVPEYAFAVDVGPAPLALSGEHSDLRWLDYREALRLLHWDSNRTALWELNERLGQEDRP